MARSPRPKPARLPEKLLQIRLALNLSQGAMLHRLGLDERLSRTTVSAYELGTGEPPLPVLLEYARLANVWVDVLIDDELDLPAKLPSAKKHEGVRRRQR
ncbi:MAG TPA: helix-turn-helix domain-containing protein [Pyrinomonadaceae bacterium]|nr:helix-turn-helix domain-containing protein [Pyrinomonadaceae bacterium]